MLGLKPGEFEKTAVFFVYLMVCSAIFISGRTVRDTLFLSEYSIAWLPGMMIGYGVVSSLLATFYGRLADRVRRDRLVVATALVFAASYVLIWAAVKAGWTWIYLPFYIWAEVAGTLIISQFWGFANDLHNARDAKRLFGLIGAGRVLGIAVCGLSITGLARWLGTANLILLIVASMIAVAVLAVYIRRRFVPTAPPAQAITTALALPPTQRDEPVLGSRYAKLLAAVSFLMFVVCQLADYQFKAVARATYSKDELAAYFGTLYAAIGGIAFILQFFCTAKILARFGLLAGLVVMPLALMGSSWAMALAPGILAASLLKFSDNAFQYSINEASVQLLYFPFPAGAKGRIRALMDGVVNPLGFGLAGAILLVAAGRMQVQTLGFFTIPAIVIWLGLILLVCREYVTALARTLRDRRLRHGHAEEGPPDWLTQNSLIELAEDKDEATALFALDLLRKRPPEALVPHVGRLLASPHRAVQVAVLRFLEEVPSAAPLEAIERAMAEGNPSGMRAAAIAVYCAALGEEAIERVLPAIASPDESVRAAVVAGLMRHCGLDGVLATGSELQRLLASPVAHDRKLAARILGRIGARHFYRQLVPLLSDPEPEVKKEAARAARLVLNPKLIPALVVMLGEDDVADSAERALAGFGDLAVGALDALLAGGAASRDAAKGASRTLRRIATPRALAALVGHMEYPDSRVRRKILRATVRLHGELGRPHVLPGAVLEERLSAEVGRAFQLMVDRQAVVGAYPGQLLEDTFGQDMERTVDRVWSLLGLSFDSETVVRCRRSLRSGTAAQRSNALEVLDNSVAAPLKVPLLALLEGGGDAERVRVGGRFFALRSRPPMEWFAERLERGGAWHRAVAIDAAGFHRIGELTERAKAALGDPVPLVREAAVWSLARILGEGASSELARVRDDAELSRRRIFRWLRANDLDIVTMTTQTGGMTLLTTLEEVVFMRHIPIFAGVAAEHLAALAELTVEVFAAAGQEIVRQGEPGDSMFLIINGQVEVLVNGHRIGLLGPKECFGEMALVDGETRSATVRAMESTDLLTLGHDEFHEFLEERPEVSLNVLRIFSSRIRALSTQLADRMTKAAADAGPAAGT